MQHQQYELMWQDGHPVAYVNWAWLTLETSVTYRDTQCLLTEADWVAGDQLWFMEIIAAKENLMPFLKRLRHRFSSGIQAHWHEVRAHHAVICKSIRLP